MSSSSSFLIVTEREALDFNNIFFSDLINGIKRPNNETT